MLLKTYRTSILNEFMPPDFGIKAKYKPSGIAFYKYNAWVSLVKCVGYYATRSTWNTPLATIECNHGPRVGLDMTGNKKEGTAPLLLKHYLWSAHILLHWWERQRTSPQYAETNFVTQIGQTVMGVGRAYYIAQPGESAPLTLETDQSEELSTLSAKVITEPSTGLRALDAEASKGLSIMLGAGELIGKVRFIDGRPDRICQPIRFYLIIMRFLLIVAQVPPQQPLIATGLNHWETSDDFTFSIHATSKETAEEGEFTNGRTIAALVYIAEFMAAEEKQNRFREFEAIFYWDRVPYGKIMFFKGQTPSWGPPLRLAVDPTIWSGAAVA